MILSSSSALRGRYTRMCCIRLTNMQLSKNRFARDNHTPFVLIVELLKFHNAQGRTLSVICVFYYLDRYN